VTAPHLTLVIGPETLLVDRAISSTLASIRASSPDAQVTTFSGDDPEAAAKVVQAASPTLFGDAVVIVLHSIDGLDDDGAAAIRAVIGDLDPQVWLIATHPGGNKGKALLDAMRTAGAHQIDAPAIKKGRAMMDYLSKEVAAKKRTTTSDALQTLVDAIGPDIRMLTAALDQLMSDIEHDPITATDVRTTFGGMAEIAGWTIADRVWERKTAAALTDLRWSMQTTDGARLGPSTVAALARGLRNMVLVGTSAPGASDADVAKEVGIQPWLVKGLRRQWSSWSGDRRRVARAIVHLAEADGAMKGGVLVGSSLDPEQKMLELERLVMELSARKGD